MTYAPNSIKAARSFLVEHLDMHPLSSSFGADLDPAEVGIVGDTGHAATGTSYHLGKSQLRSDSYSIVESSRDRGGLTDAASALDIGSFSVSIGGKIHSLRTFSAWLVAQCSRNTPDTADIREVIYSLDGQTVHRWDRLKKRTSGDSTHLYHTHISYFRDSEGRDKTALLRRYLTEIGLLEGDDMALNLSTEDKAAIRQECAEAVVNYFRGAYEAVTGAADADTTLNKTKRQYKIFLQAVLGGPVDQVALMTAITGLDQVDEMALAAALLPGLNAGLGSQVIAMLQPLIDAGTLTAAEVQAAVEAGTRNVLRTGVE